MPKFSPGTNDLREAMELYSDLIYSIALSHLRYKADAEDVLQEVFLLYHSKSPVFESEAARKSWLIKTAVFKCRQFNDQPFNRNTERRDEMTITDMVSFDSPAESQVFKAVMELKEKYRIPLYMRCILGLSGAETAQALGLTENNVNVRVNRAKGMIKRKLGGEYFE